MIYSMYFYFLNAKIMSNKITLPAVVKEVKPLTVKEIKILSAKAQKAIKVSQTEVDVDSEDFNEEEASGKIASILSLFVAGVPAKFIVRLGYNKSTVYRQTGELTKLQKKPALNYFGYELFEARVLRTIKEKGLTRAKAVEFLIEKDLA